jgi:heme-degrading monooxygenase HmoA
MFSVIFEVHPKSDQWDAYLGYAKMLRPELERIDGFVDNIRYRSLTREGWILSLSGWRDEKALVRWRTLAKHHEVQERGRAAVFLDYHLRVGQVTQDTRLPAGHALREQRMDETETGEGTTVTLIDGRRPPEWVERTRPEEVATWLGLRSDAAGLAAWDVFDAVLTPGDVILLASGRGRGVRGDHGAAGGHAAPARSRRARLRHVRPARGAAVLPRREPRVVGGSPGNRRG